MTLASKRMSAEPRRTACFQELSAGKHSTPASPKRCPSVPLVRNVMQLLASTVPKIAKLRVSWVGANKGAWIVQLLQPKRWPNVLEQISNQCHLVWKLTLRPPPMSMQQMFALMGYALTALVDACLVWKRTFRLAILMITASMMIHLVCKLALRKYLCTLTILTTTASTMIHSVWKLA